MKIDKKQQSLIDYNYVFPAGSGPFIITERIFNLPDVEMFIGYSNHQPACTSMLIKTGRVAGIYWVATLDKYRGNGFGKSITLQSAFAGKVKKCDFASLQASDMGKPLYESIGFSNPYNYKSYSSPEESKGG